MMSSARARALLQERAKREKFPLAVDAVYASLFDRQRALVDSPHKRKIPRAGRRSGKTHSLAARAFRAAQQYPGATIPVFERTLSCTAANTFWKLLQDFDRKFKLNIDFHHTARTATLPNKSVVAILGADTIEAADKHRGGKFPVAIVDEAGTFRSKVLAYLLAEVVGPATMDYDGEILVSGTPGLDPVGTFYDMCHNAEWEQHHWTVLENPTMGFENPDVAALAPADHAAWRVEWLARERRLNGWSETTPRYLREYMGLWVSGSDDRVFPLDRSLNVVPALPELGRGERWVYFLGLDLGFADPTAFVVLARRSGDSRTYVVKSYEQTGLIPSAVAAHVERLRTEFSFHTIVADTGGYGKGVAEEMKASFGLPIEAAEKSGKRVAIEHAAGELASGRIVIVSGTNRELLDDMWALPWGDVDEDGDKAPDPRFRDHLTDAMLYALRAARRAYPATGLGEYDASAYGSLEWWREREEAMEAAAEEQHRRAKEPDDDGTWGDIGEDP